MRKNWKIVAALMCICGLSLVGCDVTYDYDVEVNSEEETDPLVYDETTEEITTGETTLAETDDLIETEEYTIEAELDGTADDLSDYEVAASTEESYTITYTFRKDSYLEEHFEKHGQEFPYATAEDYLIGANLVIENPDALTKTEAEDGDMIYYVEETNEIVFLSTDGYIRSYFKPSAGIAYFNRQ